MRVVDWAAVGIAFAGAALLILCADVINMGRGRDLAPGSIQVAAGLILAGITLYAVTGDEPQ